MAVNAESDGCTFCGTPFNGVGSDKAAAEADAYSTLMNHQLNCSSNPANQE